VTPGSTLDTIIFFADDGTAYTMRINEVPATTGYGEPITKFFKLADGVKVIGVVTTDPRFTPADQPAKDDTPGGPYLVVTVSNGYILRLPLASFRPESTKAGRRYAKVEEGDKVVMIRLLTDETGVMLASAGGHLIHFQVDTVSILSGVGKGVMGMKVEDDVCIGGVLVGGRFDKLVVETESGKSQEFGPGMIKSQNRGGKGEKPGARTKFTRVLPTAIELVNWDEVEGKAKPKDKGGDKPGQNGSLFDE
jgi:DNA gyrase subunit A